VRRRGNVDGADLQPLHLVRGHSSAS
jgi:hypothetical protein